MRRDHPAHPRPGGAALGLLPQALETSMIVLPGPRYRAVLETSALSLSLLSADAAITLEATYHRFLAGLDYPLQIVARTQVAHAAPYLARLRACLRQEQEPALVRLLLAQIAHLERIIATQAPLERHFYVVVPAPEEPPRAAPHSFWRRTQAPVDSHDNRAAAARALAERCQAVAAGLRAVGLQVHRLETAELAALWQACLCPRTARLQPLAPDALAAVDLPILTWPRGGERHALVSP